MSLLKKSRKVTIEGKSYVMMFDMKSVAMFREITGQTFTNAMPNLFAGDDFTILGFLGATLRPASNIKAPVGHDIFNAEKFDSLGLLLNHGKEVTALIAQSLPKTDTKKK